MGYNMNGDRLDGFCDLHIHSTSSDGALGVGEILEVARRKGLKAISITDHDSIDSQEELVLLAKKLGMEVASGIEFSVDNDNSNIHVLGYFIDFRNTDLLNATEELRTYRMERAEKILEKLRSKGFDISINDVISGDEDIPIGRPHIAMAMYRMGFVSSYSEAFDMYLSNGASCYVPKKVFNLDKVMELIKSAGGVPVWAHPGWSAFDSELLNRFLALGIRGIEVWHPNHTPELESNLLELAMEKGLVATGGSDFHSYEAERVEIGTKGTPYRNFLRLKEIAGIF